MASLTEVRTDQFDELVLKSSTPVLVDFWATWCTTCNALTPKLEEIASQLAGRATVVKVNIEESPEIAVKYSVRGLPVLLFFKNGEMKNILTGNHPKETILKAFEPLL